MENLILFTLFLPLLTAFVLWVGRNHWSKTTLATIACFSTFVGLVCSFLLPNKSISYTWFQFASHSFTIDFQTDKLCFLMLVLVHAIALLVQIYSVSYMNEDAPNFGRYFAFLQVFIFAKLGIVMAGNLLQMFVFWELVGLASYALIGFWYEKATAIHANQKAFLMNRVGDAGFLIGILMVFHYFKTWNFQELAQKANFVLGGALSNCPPSWEALWKISYTSPENYIFLTIMGVCLLMGTIGKSAQFPLQSWLPDAMEGPTPVSALIHAATMVVAGVFLLVRIFPILTPSVLLMIIGVGTITMFWGAWQALQQNDIKKLLAYSTISQLGLMVLAVGVGSPNAAMFHLTTHAFFKAGLFLCAGVVIHTLHQQDMRLMGGLKTKLPLLFYIYGICAAALAGLPLFSGFLSKDTILIAIATWADFQGFWGYVVLSIVCVSSLLTAIYMARQVFFVFFGEDKSEVHHLPDAKMYAPIIILALCSLGFVFSWNPFLADNAWFFQIFRHEINPKWHWLGFLSAGLAGLGSCLGFRYTQIQTPTIFNFDLYTFGSKIVLNISRFFAWFDKKVLDGLVNTMAQIQLFLADIAQNIDTYLIDGSVNGIARAARKIGFYTRQIQGGQVQMYVLYLFVGLLLILFFL